jgi:hypothetical protein
MYQPSLARFQSRDPLSGNGIDLLTDTGFHSNRLAAMRDDPRMFAQNREHKFAYARNNPSNRVDPSGLRCQIGIHCYSASSASSGSGGLGRHCGLTVTDDTHTFWIDGQWINGLRIHYDRHPRPEYDPNEYEHTAFSDSVCACLKNYAPIFNNAGVSYWFTCNNSNWALKCMTERCGIIVEWPGGPPTGWECDVCVEWEHPWCEGPGRFKAPRCKRWAPKKCP